MMRNFLLFVFVIAACTRANATYIDTTVINKIMQTVANPIGPATEIGIIEDGKIIFSKGYGKSDIERNVSPGTTTNFNIGSNSKQFTATCIFLLQEEGKLSRNDDIRKYIPEMPDYGHVITIDHLLHHTSGIRDYLELAQLLFSSPGDMSEEQRLKLITGQKELNFVPGDHFLYSNSGYFLLGVIVERVSGMPLHKFIRKNILDPLGMENTFFSEEQKVSNPALDYAVVDSNFVLQKNKHYTFYGEGGMLSNVEDLLKWDQNFYHNILGKGSQQLISELQQTGYLTSGQNTGYGAGLFCGDYKGTQVVYHGGGYHSYSTQILRFPKEELTVIYLSAVNYDPDEFAFLVADVLLYDKQLLKKTPDASNTGLKLGSFAGYYFDTSLCDYRSVRQENGHLIISGQEFSQINDSVFFRANLHDWSNFVRFGSNDRDSFLVMYYDYEHNSNYSGNYLQLKEDSLDPHCIGKYYCPELIGSSVEIRRDTAHGYVFVFNGMYNSYTGKTFGYRCIVSSFNAMAEFQRNDSGEVTGFELSSDRVKHLRFVKG